MEQQGSTTYPNDQWAQLTLGSVVESVTDNGLGPAVRMASGALTAYFAQCNTHEIKLYKAISSTFTQLGTDAAAAAAGDVIYIEAQGTSILVKKNGTTIIGPITDSGIASGKAGMWCSQSATVPTGDNFLAGNFIILGNVYPVDIGNRPRPGRGPYSVGRYFRPSSDAFTPPPNITVAPPAGSLTLTGLIPTVTATANQLIQPPVGTLTLTGFAPTVLTPVTIPVPAGSLSLTGFAPVVSVGAAVTVSPPAGSLTLTGNVPTVVVSDNQLVAVPAGSLGLTGLVPTVSATQNVLIDAPLAQLTITGLAPTVQGDVVIPIPGGGGPHEKPRTHRDLETALTHSDEPFANPQFRSASAETPKAAVTLPETPEDVFVTASLHSPEEPVRYDAEIAAILLLLSV